MDFVAPGSYDADFVANPYLVATACRAEATSVHNMYTPAAAKRLLRFDARWLARLRWAPSRHARTVALKTKHAERKKAQRETKIARQQDTSLVPVIKRQIKAVNKEIRKLMAKPNLTDQQRQLKLNAKNQRIHNLYAKLNAAMDVDIIPIGDTSCPVDEEQEQEQEEAEYGVPTTDDENDDDDDDNDDDAKVNIKMIEAHYSLYLLSTIALFAGALFAGVSLSVFLLADQAHQGFCLLWWSALFIDSVYLYDMYLCL